MPNLQQSSPVRNHSLAFVGPWAFSFSPTPKTPLWYAVILVWSFRLSLASLPPKHKWCRCCWVTVNWTWKGLGEMSIVALFINISWMCWDCIPLVFLRQNKENIQLNVRSQKDRFKCQIRSRADSGCEVLGRTRSFCWKVSCFSKYANS